MTEYTVKRVKTLQPERPVVQMSLSAYERLQDRLVKLSGIESAARTLLNYLEPGSPMYENNRLRALRYAIRAYDGWEDDDGAVQDAISGMQGIIDELESRDEL